MVIVNGQTYDAEDFANGGHNEVITAGTGEELIRFLAAIADCVADASRARSGTSATSKNAALSGSQSWVLDADVSFGVGSYFTAGSRGTTSAYYLCRTTGYVSATKTLTGTVVAAAGSGGPYTDWDIMVSGPQGDTGPAREVNRLVNGTFAVQQRATAGTADNSYGLDCWRLLLEAANAATVAQDTADAPTRAKYAAKLVVGSANNNKFGLFQPIEGKRMWDLRGQSVSVRIPLKATAAITDVRIGICQFTGTEDAVSGDPVSSWGAAGTNPTLAANWSFANTPANLNVTTAWADYLVENVSISASATNLAVLIWCDDKTTTTTTDVLRVGGYAGLWPGAAAPDIILPDYADELRLCQRYYYEINGTAKPVGAGQCTGTTAGVVLLPLPAPMRTAPAATISSAAHYGVTGNTGSLVSCTAVSLDATARPGMAKIDFSTASGLAAGNGTWMETQNASASLGLSAEL